MSITLKPEAEADLEEAAAWYRRRRSGLDVEFIEAVDKVMALIGQRPRLHAKVHGEFRRALVAKFPYAIYYLARNGEVTVYCIVHQRRSPSVWRTRLDE